MKAWKRAFFFFEQYDSVTRACTLDIYIILRVSGLSVLNIVIILLGLNLTCNDDIYRIYVMIMLEMAPKLIKLRISRFFLSCYFNILIIYRF